MALVYFSDRAIIIFFAESLKERLLYQMRIQAHAQGLSPTKNPFIESQPDCSRLRAKNKKIPFTLASLKVIEAPSIHRGGFHNTANTMLCNGCVTLCLFHTSLAVRNLKGYSKKQSIHLCNIIN